MVGLDWLDLDFFFHHFFQGSVPKFEFRPKMRTRRAWGRRGGGRGRRGLLKTAPCLSKTSPCSHGAPGGAKRAQKRPHGGKGAPPWAWALWALWALWGPMWAHIGPHRAHRAHRAQAQGGAPLPPWGRFWALLAPPGAP